MIFAFLLLLDISAVLTNSDLGTHCSFSSSESESGLASDVSVAINPTVTFASSSASSFSDPDSLSKSS